MEERVLFDHVKGALRAGLSVSEHVRMDLGRAEVVVAQQVLHGADVGPLCQEVSGKEMPQSETTSSLRLGRSVWQLAALVMPAAWTAHFTAFWTAEGERKMGSMRVQSRQRVPIPARARLGTKTGGRRAPDFG